MTRAISNAASGELAVQFVLASGAHFLTIDHRDSGAGAWNALREPMHLS